MSARAGISGRVKGYPYPKKTSFGQECDEVVRCIILAMTDRSSWGPLAALIGEWEGAEGRDVSYHNAHGQVRTTPYRERVTLEPLFGREGAHHALHVQGFDRRRRLSLRIDDDVRARRGRRDRAHG